MSTICPVPPAEGPAPNGSASSAPGFKSFWRKSDAKSPSQTDVTFVQQDPSSKRGGNRLSRILKRGSKPTASELNEGESSGKTEGQKRRQQVYQAQKRHRNRKAEYVKSLEEEVARLQHLDSVVNNEKATLAFQNQQMKELLASKSLDFQLGTMDLAPSVSAAPPAAAAVEMRYDPEIGHDRTFIDWSEFENMDWATSESSNAQTISQSATPSAGKAPVKGDSWAAADFILALEWCCQGHIHHHGINPDAFIPEACQEDGLHGHALTATATVYQGALAADGQDGMLRVPQGSGVDQSQKGKWQLPHAEIDKLVEMSSNLPIDDESITPAQAYSAIKEAVPSDEDLRPALDAMKVPLCNLVQCQGFGAVMPAESFWKELDKMIEDFQKDE